MSQTITHNNLDFSIDTSDWSDSSDAERAGHLLEAWLREHAVPATLALHRALSALEPTGRQAALIEEADEAGDRCGREARSAWANEPQGGHNCTLGAVGESRTCPICDAYGVVTITDDGAICADCIAAGAAQS